MASFTKPFICSYAGFILQFCVQMITLCILTLSFFTFVNSCYCLPKSRVFLEPSLFLQADSAKHLQFWAQETSYWCQVSVLKFNFEWICVFYWIIAQLGSDLQHMQSWIINRSFRIKKKKKEVQVSPVRSLGLQLSSTGTCSALRWGIYFPCRVSSMYVGCLGSVSQVGMWELLSRPGVSPRKIHKDNSEALISVILNMFNHSLWFKQTFAL